MIEQTKTDAADDLRFIILDALGLTLSAKRREVIAARAASGIESDWTGDEEFYQGFDDANRHEFANVVSKPTQSGGTSEPVRQDGSVVFPNITQPFVDAVSARVGDVLLPTDDRNFALEPTEIPEMMEGQKDEAPATQGLPAPSQTQPGQPGQPQQAALTPTAQAAKEFARYKAEALRRAKKAESRIDDWLGECQYHGELRKVFDDAAKLGSGVIKGPVPVKCRSNVWMQDDHGEAALATIEEIKPASIRIDPWNLYPDYPACGESIHNGSFIWEYDQISQRKLEDLKGLPGYIDSQIDKCLAEGPTGSGEASRRTDLQARSASTLYDIWYYHGTLRAEEMMAAGCECEDERTSYPARLTMVNNRVINAALNPLDTGQFPYDIIPWKRKPGMPWGMSLGRQLRTPQRIVVGATRRLMDNAGLGSGPQIVVRRGVSPQNGIWEIKPMKIWQEDDESTGQAASPVSAVLIPMLQVELTNIIQLGMKMAEDVTGMPALMQGQQGSAPDTVGGMEILNNNANAVLRRIARQFDSCVTEPHIRRYYAWLMQYGEDADEKGDFQIIARGSTALVERDIQSREMINVLQLCLNPNYGKNPKKAMDEYLKSRRYAPAAFDYTEEELAKLQSQEPQKAPQVQAAEIRAQTDMKRAQLNGQIALKRTQIEAEADLHRTDTDVDREKAQIQAQAQKDANESALRMKELEMRLQLAQLDYASRNQISLDQLKTKLADTSMKLNVTRQLAGMKAPASALSTPPIEPAGRASSGRSYQA